MSTASSRAGILLSVVMPVYNERATIEEILLRVQAVAIDKELIIVDDGSTDGTRALLEEVRQASLAAAPVVRLPRSRCLLDARNIVVLLQDRNCGKGAAVRWGFRQAQGEIVIIQDADLEYDPRDYARLLEPILRGEADVVYGSRFRGGNQGKMTARQYYGNRILTALSNRRTGLRISDVYVGYKAFRRAVLPLLDLREDRFGIELEITAKVARGRWRIREVPILYHPRTRPEGKKITWKDGVAGAWYILRP